MPRERSLAAAASGSAGRRRPGPRTNTTALSALLMKRGHSRPPLCMVGQRFTLFYGLEPGLIGRRNEKAPVSGAFRSSGFERQAEHFEHATPFSHLAVANVGAAHSFVEAACVWLGLPFESLRSELARLCGDVLEEQATDTRPIQFGSIQRSSSQPTSPRGISAAQPIGSP